MVLTANSIGDDGAAALAGAIVEMKSLETVWLHGVSTGSMYWSYQWYVLCEPWSRFVVRSLPIRTLMNERVW